MMVLELSLELGNVPAVLNALADARIAQQVANAAAESYVDDTLLFINENRAFKARTGQLEQSIGWLPSGNGTAEIYANAEYAPYVEFGTRPHIINAKNRKALKIPSAGGFIFRRSAHHKGSRPFPFFYTDTEARTRHMNENAGFVLARILNQ